jgi:hypothetical protein
LMFVVSHNLKRRHLLPAVRKTRALPFARLGKKRLPCVAYGKMPTTERGNGLWRQFVSISIRATTASGLGKRPARARRDPARRGRPRSISSTPGWSGDADARTQERRGGPSVRAIPDPVLRPLWERHSRMERQRSQRRGRGRPHRRRGLAASRRRHARARRLRAGGSFRNQGCRKR